MPEECKKCIDARINDCDECEKDDIQTTFNTDDIDALIEGGETHENKNNKAKE